MPRKTAGKSMEAPSNGKKGKPDFSIIAAMVLLLLVVGIFTIMFLRFDYTGVLIKMGFVGLFLVSFFSSLIFFTFPSEPIIVLSVKLFFKLALHSYPGHARSTLAAVLNYYIGLEASVLHSTG